MTTLAGDAHVGGADDPAEVLAPRYQPPRTWKLKLLQVSADTVAIAVAMALGLVVARGLFDAAQPWSRHVGLVAGSLPVWLLCYSRYGLYCTRFVRSRMDEWRRICHATAAGAVVTAVAGYMLELYASRAWLVASAFAALALVTIERQVVRLVLARLRIAGRLLKPVVLVGGNDEALALCSTMMDDPSLGYRVVGFVADHPAGSGDLPSEHRMLGTVNETLSAVCHTGAVGVVIATTGLPYATVNRLTRELVDAGVRVELSLALQDVVTERLTLTPLGRHPVVYVDPARYAGWRLAAKRALDLVVATTMLLLVLPALAAIALAIKVESPGPVLFRQRRVGKGGTSFEVLKLRTMVDGAEAQRNALVDSNEASGPLFKMAEDPRCTTVGAWLRRWSLDELPQLWNVIRGEMSMVGPRPALAEEMQDWTPELHGRLRVKPGITGMWQVSRRPDWSWDDYVRHDLHYVENWSLLTDIAIGLKTIPAVLLARTNR